MLLDRGGPVGSCYTVTGCGEFGFLASSKYTGLKRFEESQSEVIPVLRLLCGAE